MFKNNIVDLLKKSNFNTAFAIHKDVVL